MSKHTAKTKILMVCLGNICRSPIAHGILESKLPSNLFTLDSAGTASYHIGNQPDHRSVAIALKNGLDISKQTARQFSVNDFENFDIIYAMDKSNYENILRLANSKADKIKVKLILEENLTLTLKDVPDPYYGGDSGFSKVYNMLENTCDIIAKTLLK